MKPFSVSRRRFLQSSSTLLASAALGAYGEDLVNRPPRRVGLIGTGWYGKNDLFRLIQVAPVEVVGLCDPDARMLAGAAAMVAERQPSGRTPRTYADHRELLEREDCELVLIGSPDHWHALHMIDAVKAGADVYVQKPTSVDVLESEAMLAAARALGRVVQVGTQRRSTPHLVEAKRKVVDAGLLGKVGHVEMCCYYHMRMNERPEVREVPDFFDYDRWTGPAPLLPFTGLPHRRWRAYMEYSNGIIGDMCVHMYDTVRWMLGLGAPLRVHSSGGVRVQTGSAANTPDTQVAVFEHEDLSAVWQHRSWGTTPDGDYPWALFLHGEKGTLKASVNRYEFVPHGGGAKREGSWLDEREKFPEDEKEPGMEIHVASASRRHLLDFLAAVDQRSKPVADIAEGVTSTVACILANLAMETGRSLAYDPATRTVPGDPEATELLARPYRGPWERPGIG